MTTQREQDAVERVGRRSALKRLGSVVTASTVGLSGCIGEEGGSGGTTTPTTTASPTSTTEEPTATDETPTSTEETTTATTREIEDTAGRTVEIPSEISRLVALGPGALNYVVYAGGADLIVGVEKNETTWGQQNPYNKANPQLRDLPVIGPPKGGEPSLITNQEPDLILGTMFTAGKANDLQSQTETPVVVAKGSHRTASVDEFAGNLEFIGDVLGTSDRVSELVGAVRDRVSDLDERTSDVPQNSRASVYLGGRSFGGGVGVTSTEHPFPPFQWVNASNVASSVSGHAMVDREKILTWDPEVLFVPESNLDRVKTQLAKSVYSDVTAVAEGELYGIFPNRLYGLMYGSVLANAYYIGSVLYPDQFDDVSPMEEAGEIYETFVGEDVSDQMAEAHGGFMTISLE